MSDADSLKVPFSRPSISEEENKLVLEVLNSGWLTTGKYALEFEKDFSTFMNSKPEMLKERKKIGLSAEPVQSLAVNSNTSGMILAMEACGIGPGTAVITTPYTFVSTAACAKHLGAEVYFADIEKDSYNIDPEKVEEILLSPKGKNVKAIVPVHVAGNLCNMKKICQIAQKFGVKVIEDAAHAFPSPTEIGYAGTIGDVGVFSFYVTKTITTAEGGMVCTRDSNLAKRMTVMRLHGMDRTTWDRYTSPRASWEYDIVALGYKFNLPDILAAIGVQQLKKAETFYEKRIKIVKKYNDAFRKLDFIQLPPDGKGNAWHLYLMRIVPEKLKINREEFAKKLQQSGIGISVHFIPLFYFTYWKSLYPDFTAENYPEAAERYSQTISIPLWPDMTEEMADLVIAEVTRIGKENHA
ncbi:MAG: DegT/DnrJ/EryC1/StrS family aminotransferase [Treponema sp.]|jgi:dTDP-4-amino-4,6-dideoxygalactose transaminase|nr:DegT/DnrJ/EryC1/StrS family aminotransferase [Treponema sp.]